MKFAGLNLLGGDHTAFIDNVRIQGSPVPGLGVEWLVTDQLGTPRLVFDKSGALLTTKRHDYLPFGEELMATTGLRTTGQGFTGAGFNAADGVRQKFTQKERDNETGLDYFGARYYASLQGRFMGVDPITVTIDRLADPQRLNLYGYVRNNPLVLLDPTGEDITVEGGTDLQKQAVLKGITTLREQSASAEKAFAVYDPQPNGKGPNLSIYIEADSDFEKNEQASGKPGVLALTSQSGGDEADPSVKVGAQVQIRASAIDDTQETNERDANHETLVEGILSHEVVGHGQDIYKDPAKFESQNQQDKLVDYQKRRNEVSADRATKIVGVERVTHGHLRINDLRRDIRFGGKLLP